MDRIVLKSEEWVVKKIEIIGKESFECSGITGQLQPITFWPSDHFGLYTEIESNSYKGERQVQVHEKQSKSCVIQ